MVINPILPNKIIESYMCLVNGYSAEFLKDTYYKDIPIPLAEVKDYALMQMSENLLIDWQFRYHDKLNDSIIKYIEISKDLTKVEYRYDDTVGLFDGYAQFTSYVNAALIDKQAYQDEHNVFIFLADVNGGLITIINKSTYEIKFFAIGEDDGYWFISDGLWISKDFQFYKQQLLSEISELHIEGFQHQIVIEKIFNMKKFDVIPLDSWSYRRYYSDNK